MAGHHRSNESASRGELAKRLVFTLTAKLDSR